MTTFERFYYLISRFDHPLYQHVHHAIRKSQSNEGRPLDILDVGGRRSNYTIGLASRITVSDIERQSAEQHALDLGATEDIQQSVMRRRSNIERYVIDDMTHTRLEPESFDLVIAVEVLEHVKDDAAFIDGVSKVLRPNGMFIMTTPNGDFLPEPYQGHWRHYRAGQLAELLSRRFSQADISYVVNAGRLIALGVHKPSLGTPVRTLISPAALFLSYFGELAGVGGRGPAGKRHLLAIATK